MYIQKTKFYCQKCRTHDHWGNEVCPKDRPALQEVSALKELEKIVPPLTRFPEHPEIKKVQRFLDAKRGRPKVYPDRKTQMRELMRRKRASKKV